MPRCLVAPTARTPDTLWIVSKRIEHTGVQIGGGGISILNPLGPSQANIPTDHSNRSRGSAARTGADLLWRVKRDTVLPLRQALADGSFLSEFGAAPARVIEYTIAGTDEPSYRLLTTRLDPLQAPAVELAAFYHERWEIESAYNEIKTHLLGRHPIVRSKTPPLVRQVIEGLMLAHYAARRFLHEAAQEADEDPDRLSVTHAVQVLRRRIRNPGAFPPARRLRRLAQAVQDEILEERAESSRGQSKPRGVKRKMSKYKIRHRGPLSGKVHDWKPEILVANH